MCMQEEAYAHSYAYDWRTKQPTIFRATDQWFASVDGFRCSSHLLVDGDLVLRVSHHSHTTNCMEFTYFR